MPFCRSNHAAVDLRCELEGVDRLLAVLEGRGDVDEHERLGGAGERRLEDVVSLQLEKGTRFSFCAMAWMTP